MADVYEPPCAGCGGWAEFDTRNEGPACFDCYQGYLGRQEAILRDYEQEDAELGPDMMWWVNQALTGDPIDRQKAPTVEVGAVVAAGGYRSIAMPRSGWST